MPASADRSFRVAPRRSSLPVMSGKRAFLELLKQEGVATMFGNPGTTELPLMDALAVDNEMRYVLALQEAAVMAMADGYAQASGKLAVVNLQGAQNDKSLSWLDVSARRNHRGKRAGNKIRFGPR